MFLILSIFAFAKLKTKGLLMTLFLGVIISIVGLLPSLSFLTGSRLFESFVERSVDTSEDIRFQLWEVSWAIARENILTGIGFGNYVSDVYRYRIGENANLGFEGFGSPHNSFIDLIWIGGIWLVIIYSIILAKGLAGGIKLLRNSDMDIRAIGALVTSLITGIFLFSFTGQSATDKRTWIMLAICYLWIEEGKQRLKYQSK
ncbi:MAG: O-antigen ligase family protein [Saprospiraceae bacterium]|nr:O-antigen ligase family protein [Saprospiraceae bacterium]